MIVFLNGEFVPEEKAVVSIFDRSFLYGDGLFESVRVCEGRLFRWEQHLERLERGAAFLGLKIPFAAEALGRFARQLIDTNQIPEALLRLTLSRGVGMRGYLPKGADHPALAMSLHPLPAPDLAHPPAWRLITASFRLPANEPLAQFKTCNKLPQILARAQADAAGADEALLLNTEGFVVEASSGNLFWIRHGAICSSPLASGVLAGVTRATIFELAANLRYALREENISRAELGQVEGIFLSLSSVGIAEGIALDQTPLPRSPIVTALHQAYWHLARNRPPGPHPQKP